jgi:hypothetical protein
MADLTPFQTPKGASELLADSKMGNWNTKKSKEEYESARSRLSDQKFDISRSSLPLNQVAQAFVHPYRRRLP